MPDAIDTAAPANTTEAPSAPAAPATAPPAAVKASESGKPLTAPIGDKIAAAVARIKAMEAKPAEPAKDEATPAEAPKEEPKVEAKPEDKPPAPTPEEELAKDPKVAERLAYLAKKDAAARAEHQKRMAELAESKAEVDAVKQFLTQFERDPATALRSFVKGDTKKQIAIAEAFYLDAIGGEKATPELKARQEQLTLRREIDELRRRDEERDRAAHEQVLEAQRQAAVETYKGAIASHLEATAAKHTHVAAYLKHDREGTLSALVDLAGNLVLSQPEMYPPGSPPRPEDVVPLLEQSLAEELAWVKPLYAPPPAPPAPAAPKPQPVIADEQKPAPKTLSSTALAAPTKPRTKAMTEDERIARAVQRINAL